MSYQVYRWNKEQVNLHNIGVHPRIVKNTPLQPCFKQYQCDRSSCIRDSGHCQFETCKDKLAQSFDQKALCHYTNNPADSEYTYNIYSNKKLYGFE